MQRLMMRRQAEKAEKESSAIEPSHLPQHVAIVMDGNGRWAKERGLPRIAGHRAGAENIRRVIECTMEHGLKHLTLYAFSSENWARPEDEISGLMAILGDVIERETPRLAAEGIRLRHLGRLDRLPPDLRDSIQYALAKTERNDRLNLNICFDYGGRGELLDAVKRIVAAGIPANEINEDVITRFLYSYGSPDPDLIIRTAGEQRLSNFLVWQAAYSEYWFTPCYWPDFGKNEFRQALGDYAKRLRKFGMTPEQVQTAVKPANAGVGG